MDEDKTAFYSLIDQYGNRIYDLVRYNCSGMKKDLWTIDTINQNVISELSASYYKWWKLFKKEGLRAVRNKNITPVSFSNYKWIKEIGYLSSDRSSKEILELCLSVRKDSNYLQYFIKSNDLSRYYLDKTDQEIIGELLILSVLNTTLSYSFNVLDHTLVGSKDDILEVVEILEKTKDTTNLKSLLKEMNIKIIPGIE